MGAHQRRGERERGGEVSSPEEGEGMKKERPDRGGGRVREKRGTLRQGVMPVLATQPGVPTVETLLLPILR